MDNFHSMNPFAKRDSHSPRDVALYKILTIISWLVAVVASIYYTVRRPQDGHHQRNHTLPEQNWAYHTGFTLNTVMVEIYFIVLFAMQAFGYLSHLFSGDVAKVNSACSCGSHFILNNLLHFAFVMLFARGHFAWAEVILIVNFFNLSSLYFRHSGYPRFIHAPVVSGPLAWTFVAIYWNGAIMVHRPDALVARIFANIFVWAILMYGAFFIVVYKDYTMGFWLSVLSAALGVAQFERQIVALQWIFAFIIMSLLFISTLVIALPAWVGGKTPEPVVGDAERAPLLADN